jgi:Tfp pilus assembly protein PilF
MVGGFRTHAAVAAVISVGLYLSAAADAAAQTSGATVNIQVKDVGTEQPVFQAEVRIIPQGQAVDSQRSFTDGTGTARMGGVSRGNYYLQVSARDYEPHRENVDVYPGVTHMVVVLLKPVPASTAGGTSTNPVSAAYLVAPAQARQRYEEGMKRIDQDPDAAGKLLEKAIEEYPKFAHAHAMLGLVHYRRKRLDEAASAYHKAIELDPSLAMAHTMLGKLYLDQKRFREAETALLEGTRLDPTGWQAPYELTRCYYKMGKLAKALEFGRRAHDAPHAPTSMHLLMVDLYRQANDKQAALRELEEFMKADPKSPYMQQVKQAMEDLKK